jgi:hypothetical protein
VEGNIQSHSGSDIDSNAYKDSDLDKYAQSSRLTHQPTHETIDVCTT